MTETFTWQQWADAIMEGSRRTGGPIISPFLLQHFGIRKGDNATQIKNKVLGFYKPYILAGIDKAIVSRSNENSSLLVRIFQVDQDLNKLNNKQNLTKGDRVRIKELEKRKSMYQTQFEDNKKEIKDLQKKKDEVNKIPST
jgi:hypothetical protein